MRIATFVSATGLLVLAVATASGDGLVVPPVKDAITAKECRACHMLYPPGLLPARSWSAMMDKLSDHFGDNAELDAATTKQIKDYLVANAADAKNKRAFRDLDPSVTPPRITEMPWWKRKHEKRDRVAPATLKRKGAKFRGDCKACHEDAEQGIFEED